LEREQARRGEIKGVKRKQDTSPKVEQYRGTIATIAKASSLAKEAGGALAAGSSRTCSNGGSRKNEHSNGVLSAEGMVCSIQSICHGGG